MGVAGGMILCFAHLTTIASWYYSFQWRGSYSKLKAKMAALEARKGLGECEDEEFQYKKLILEQACYYCQHDIIRSESDS